MSEPYESEPYRVVQLKTTRQEYRLPGLAGAWVISAMSTTDDPDQASLHFVRIKPEFPGARDADERASHGVLATALRRLAVTDEMAGMGDVEDPEGLARIAHARRALAKVGLSHKQHETEQQ